MTSSLNLHPTPTVDTNDHPEPASLLKTRVCRYFSKSGSCRSGSNCPFLHDDTRLPGSKIPGKGKEDEVTSSTTAASGAGEGTTLNRLQATNQVPVSRVVAKPVSQAQTQDPREFQLGQIRRRFSPKESRQGTTAVLKFSLTPSDPDFPFEMTALECVLSVPAAYPKDAPSLKVGNTDIPRGFAFNVEAGFEGLVEQYTKNSLLELMKALDKNLEIFLSAPKVDTIKLVANKDTRHLSHLTSQYGGAITPQSRSVDLPTSSQQVVSPVRSKPVTIYSNHEKLEASKRREAETRQLEARMGRLPLYKKSGDGVAYTVPIEPKKRAQLPVALQAVKSVQLFVPLLYPLETCRVQLDGVDLEGSRAVHLGFELKAVEQSDMTLMGHINYLAQNIHLLAKTAVNIKIADPIPTMEVVDDIKSQQTGEPQDGDRSHIQYIAKPPEWTVVTAEDDSDFESDDGYSYDSDESDDADGGVEVQLEDRQTIPVHNPERGTAISFPFVELYGIELLEISILNVNVKCERCKDVTEVKGLKNDVPRNESCKKCAAPFDIRFRKDLVHANAVRAGFIDLEGCVIGDMLPSTFIPTCSQCSTAYPSPGIVSVQGETTQNVCRECHQKITFKLPQVKFLRISSTQRLPPTSGPRRKKETLGLTAGTELPKRGRCRHYTKSFRWFRFSCCLKVYACDKCHDDEEEHPHEWANRMICGWCSREGNYRPEDCGFCHGVLVGKKGGGGFWEGGKGTRDKVRMSRKDKRKFRRPGAAVRKG